METYNFDKFYEKSHLIPGGEKVAITGGSISGILEQLHEPRGLLMSLIPNSHFSSVGGEFGDPDAHVQLTLRGEQSTENLKALQTAEYNGSPVYVEGIFGHLEKPTGSCLGRINITALEIGRTY